jgi:hypothetical protein
MPAGLAAGQSAKTGPASVVAVSMHLAAGAAPAVRRWEGG